MHSSLSNNQSIDHFMITAVILAHSLANFPWGGGGGVTPLYGLYRYVPRNRVGFLEVLDP